MIGQPIPFGVLGRVQVLHLPKESNSKPLDCLFCGEAWLRAGLSIGMVNGVALRSQVHNFPSSGLAPERDPLRPLRPQRRRAYTKHN
jgi:hypothetical protein